GSHPDLVLARQRRPTKGPLQKRSRIEADSWQDVDRDLFDRLRAVRLQIARARGVPPYVIFHDTTLREMARLRPKTVGDLHGIRGIGARKAEDLGEIFLTAIRESLIPNPGSRIPDPESRIPDPESRVPSPESRVPSPESRHEETMAAYVIANVDVTDPIAYQEYIRMSPESIKAYCGK